VLVHVEGIGESAFASKGNSTIQGYYIVKNAAALHTTTYKCVPHLFFYVLGRVKTHTWVPFPLVYYIIKIGEF
jgi:hypothetical protein